MTIIKVINNGHLSSQFFMTGLCPELTEKPELYPTDFGFSHAVILVKTLLTNLDRNHDIQNDSHSIVYETTVVSLLNYG